MKTSIDKLVQPIPSYETDDYKLINDEIIIVSGYQLFSYYNSYGSLYDGFMQKVNDLEYININPNMSKFNNLVKLLNKDKQYYLNFKVDHYIKLDKKTIDANVIFIDNNGVEYHLNKNSRLIKNLTGENIKVKSDKNALLYFYKKIEDNSTMKIIEINNTNSENLLIQFYSKDVEEYSRIYAIKDFGFKECYPIINEKSWIIIDNDDGVIMIENLYDRLEYDLDEEEKYIIYIFDSFDENNLPTFNEENWEFIENYFNNPITKGNKYNFEIIPNNSLESIILNSKNKSKVTYQIIACENQEFIINFVDSLNNIKEGGTFKEYNNYIDRDLNINIDLLQLIYSEKETLFAYHFHKSEHSDEKNSKNVFKILSANYLSKNILQINYNPSLMYSLVEYHIIVSKKSDLNNNETFLNPCYIGKLMTQNSEDILVKTIFDNSELDILSTTIDISKFSPSENDEFVIDIISNNMQSENLLTFYGPIEYKLGENEILTFELNEEITFDFNKKILLNMIMFQMKITNFLN